MPLCLIWHRNQFGQKKKKEKKKGKHAAWHRTSADWSGEVPHGRVAGVGDARERGVAVQHVAGDAAVLHAVAHREAVAAAQHGLGGNAGIAARRAVELCKGGGERRAGLEFRVGRIESSFFQVWMMHFKRIQTCQSPFTHTQTHTLKEVRVPELAARRKRRL